MEESQIVLIISECKNLLKNDRAEFDLLVTTLLRQTYYLKIILVTEEPVEIKVAGNSIGHSIEVTPLSKKDAVRFIRRLDFNNEIFVN